jgi:hypothetical protein
MKIIRKAGDTSNILQVFIQDSSSTTGAGLTGLVFNSASLTAYYHKDVDTTATAISLVTMTVGTFTSLGFKEIDATNMPGWYQFCPPDAALSSGKTVGFHLKGATNMAPLAIEVQLVSVDVQNATSFGLADLDAAISSRMATYAQPAGFLAATFPSGTLANTTNITSITGNITGNLSGSVGSVTGNVGGNVTGSVGSVTGLTAANLDATISSRLASAAYTAPDNASIATILADVNSGAGAIYNRIGAPVGASIAADIAALPTANGNADALLDRAAGVETGWTLRQAARIMLSVLAGKASGLATATAVYRDMADSKNRISATVDSSGNRTAVTRDAS